MPISTICVLKYVQQCYVKWFWTISSLGAPDTLLIQTGKYENKVASIPVDERLCLVCKRNCIDDKKHFLIDLTE